MDVSLPLDISRQITNAIYNMDHQSNELLYKHKPSYIIEHVAHEYCY